MRIKDRLEDELAQLVADGATFEDICRKLQLNSYIVKMMLNNLPRTLPLPTKEVSRYLAPIVERVEPVIEHKVEPVIESRAEPVVKVKQVKVKSNDAPKRPRGRPPKVFDEEKFKSDYAALKEQGLAGYRIAEKLGMKYQQLSNTLIRLRIQT